MAFDWNGYLSLARELATQTSGQVVNQDNEAKQRCAVSRAYYSVYHSALEYAKTTFTYTPSTHNVSLHRELQKKYKQQSGNTDHREVGQILTRLHQYRVNSDYEAKDQGNLEKLLSSIFIDAERVNTILTR